MPLSLSLLTACSAAPGLGEGTQAERKMVRKENPNQTHTAGSRLGRESCLWLRRGGGSAAVQDGAGHGLQTPAWHGRGPPGLPPPHRSEPLQPRSGPAPLPGHHRRTGPSPSSLGAALRLLGALLTRGSCP